MKYPLYFYYLTVIIEDVILNIKDFDSGGFATPLTEIKEPSLILDKSSPFWKITSISCQTSLKISLFSDFKTALLESTDIDLTSPIT